MAAGTLTLYDSVAELIADGTIDLDTHTFKLQLHTSSYTPNVATQSTTSDLTNEVSNANGYTTGGATLASVTWGQTGGVATFDSDPVVWNATGAGITARYAVLVDSSNNYLVGYFLLDATPADVTTTAGNSLTITPSSGWFTLTVNP